MIMIDIDCHYPVVNIFIQGFQVNGVGECAFQDWGSSDLSELFTFMKGFVNAVSKNIRFGVCIPGKGNNPCIIYLKLKILRASWWKTINKLRKIKMRSVMVAITTMGWAITR
jgi:hypothetical protein